MLAPSLGFESETSCSASDVERYSAHMLLKEIGASGNETVQQKNILVIGAGGLGCTCISFLAAQGCRRLGIVDGDVISLSNLTRQVLYSTSHVGEPKVESAQRRCTEINPNLQVVTYPVMLESRNAESIISGYDIVCDCTDNLNARFLISDWCVLLGKPLVSAAAVRWEGHLTVYNYPYTSHARGLTRCAKPNAPTSDRSCWNHTSGCYRCLYPSSGQTDCSQNCSEAGVIGGLVGMLGSMQAIEVMKVALEMKNGNCECVDLGQPIFRPKECVLAGRMFYYNALQGSSRVFTLAARRNSCVLCGIGGIAESIEHMKTQQKSKADIFEHARTLLASLATCALGQSPQADCLPVIEVRDLFHQLYTEKRECILLDVRTAQEVEMCRLPLLSKKHALRCISMYVSTEEVSRKFEAIQAALKERADLPIYVICRRGVRSAKVAHELINTHHISNVFSVKGGLHAWREKVDGSFPHY
ncbi:ubiquitin-activating enzyme E1 [Perkinsela sp. CCAP 1560/4]|nr:ubiquitin-activating enzyme E1 [Perkinsela sp. CCAP 1560/4]|eukprot:KNH09422.1 ubiquitin-activating enzyme E1 [Perkinsela sp. CCAP 1560/4]